jgi:hypothetical protein
VEALFDLIPNSKLQYLNLSYNAMSDENFIILCNCLYMEHNLITHLNVKGNLIGDRSMEVLSSTLHETKITSLNLETNQIGDDGKKIVNLIYVIFFC